eukprot:4793435-Prymnesium_polylepis.2
MNSKCSKYFIAHAAQHRNAYDTEILHSPWRVVGLAARAEAVYRRVLLRGVVIRAGGCEAPALSACRWAASGGEGGGARAAANGGGPRRAARPHHVTTSRWPLPQPSRALIRRARARSRLHSSSSSESSSASLSH